MWPRLVQKKGGRKLDGTSVEGCVGIRKLIPFARIANQDVSPNDGKN